METLYCIVTMCLAFNNNNNNISIKIEFKCFFSFFMQWILMVNCEALIIIFKVQHLNFNLFLIILGVHTSLLRL